MKRNTLIALICALLLCTGGCATRRTWETARGTQKEDPETGEIVSDAKPAVYALLPFAVALDVVATPFLLPFMIFYGVAAFTRGHGDHC